MSIATIYQRQLDTVRADETVREAAERMRQRTVGCLVVVDEFNRPRAMLTDRDLAIRVVAEGLDPFATHVKDVMSEPATTVSAEASLQHVVSTMLSVPARRLPVVDRNDKLIGIVALDDVWRYLAQEMTLAGQLLEREAPTAVAMH